MRRDFRLAVIALTMVISGCDDAAPQAQPNSASPSPSPVASTAAPHSAPSNNVEVRMGRSSYRTGEAVQATIVNESNKPVYAEDFKTACSVLTLQIAQGDGWKDILGCAMGRPTATVAIAAGQDLAVTLDPNSIHFRNGDNRIGFTGGSYRLKFGYRLNRGEFGQEPLVVYSSTFRVN